MAFCTECGFNLPANAVFCTNCGTSVPQAPASGQTQTEPSAEESVLTQEPSLTDAQGDLGAQPEAAAPAVFSGTYSEPAQNTYAPPAAGTYTPPAAGAYVPPAAGTYTPPAAGAYVPPATNTYAPPAQAQYGAYNPNYMNPPAGQPGYGYPPQGAPVKKSGGGKIAIIVISAVVVLFALAAFLIYRAVNANPLIGYWESAAYDDGSGRLSDEYNGEMVEGLLGIQLNSDGTAFMCSAYDAEIYDGNWTKTEDGIQINDDGSVYDFVYEHKKLYMYDEGAYIIFEKNKGDINNPSLPHGYLSGSGEDLVTMPGTNAGANLAGSGTVGNNDFYIEVIGAEPFTDIDGDDAVRVYFNFENNFSYPIDAWNALYIEAEQDGSFLDSTYSYEDVEALRYMDTKIRPGISIQCCAEFKCDFYGGEMTFTFSGYDDGYDGGTVSASYSPDNLPGAPAPYVIKPVSDPGWTLNIPGEGTLDEMYYVSVLDAELITDASGEPAIRIYYTFTNNSGDPVSFYSALSPYTYQDGLSLFMSNAANDSDTDMNAYTDINPGDTIEASCVYQLRNSSSPIEAEVEAYSSFDAVGQTYSLS